MDMALRQQIGEGLEFCWIAETVFPEGARNPTEEPVWESTKMQTHCAKIGTKKDPYFFKKKYAFSKKINVVR